VRRKVVTTRTAGDPEETRVSVDGTRRAEILETAARLFATGGVRTSLQEIADACGILPGSLYHHFESKEAIIIELIERYQADLDHIAQTALDDLKRSDPRAAPDRVLALATAIAACGVRNRAALLLTFYEPPTVASDELVDLARRTPAAVERAMLDTLRLAQSNGYLRSRIDAPLFADRLVQAMLHIGIGVSHETPGAEQVPAFRCSILLNGVAARPPADSVLNRSEALQAADAVIQSWNRHDRDAEGEKAAHIRSVARAEFARRGYEATTIRDVAAAAGLSTAAVYRLVRSKGELLMSIMRSYSDSVTEGWDAVMGSDATVVEKLDALMWFNINVLDRFSEEYKISIAALPRVPLTSSNLGLSLPAQLRKIRTLLAEGVRAGELHMDKSSAEMRARSVFALLWMPENIVRQDTRGALALARDTVLRGAAERPGKQTGGKS
jgi:AcrR family transcriptional regulator